MGEANELLEMILRECAAAAPEPWYPSSYAQQTGVSRDRLDTDLDRLRLGGLVSLTDWVQGKGQGYALTAEGAELLASPRRLQRLRDNGVAPKPLEPPPPAPTGRLTPWERGEAVRATLLNPIRPRVTLTLLFLNILVFVIGMAMAMNRGAELNAIVDDFRRDGKDRDTITDVQTELGAVNRPRVILLNQWWRLFSYMFVHMGVIHLFMNMYFLYSLGPLLESMWGSVRFLVLYVVSGLAGGVAVVLANSAAIGASGALCGLLGSMPVWIVLNRAYLPAQVTTPWLRNIFMNIIMIVLLSLMPFVSTAGHFGGGLAGALVAFPLLYNRFGHGWQPWLGLAGILAVPIVSLGLLSFSVTDRERFLRIDLVLRTALDGLEETYKNHNLGALLSKRPGPSLFDDAEHVREAQTAIAQTQTQLAVTAGTLASMAPMSNPHNQEMLELAQQIVAGWSRFFETFQAVLDRRLEWTPEQRSDLFRQIRAQNDLYRRFR
jgi:membrane associated rhomboid family serine protease